MYLGVSTYSICDKITLMLRSLFYLVNKDALKDGPQVVGKSCEKAAFCCHRK